MSGIPDIVDGLFKALPSVKKVLNLADRGLDLYNPILASHAAPSAQGRQNDRAMKTGQSLLASDIDQMEGALEPRPIDGFEFRGSRQIGERLGTQTHFKFGDGMPMMGIPGVAYEKSFTWMGNKIVYGADGAPAPNLQLQVGPFNIGDLCRGRIGQTQLVKSHMYGQTFLVNDIDLQMWNMFLLGNKYNFLPKRLPLDFKTNCMIQVPGGAFQTFSGKAMAQTELALYLGELKGLQFSLGGSSTAPIPPAEGLKQIPAAVAFGALGCVQSADPYLTVKTRHSVIDKEGDPRSENFLKLAYNRKENAVELSASSIATPADPMGMHQAVNSPNFLQAVKKDFREPFEGWSSFQRNSYKIASKFNLTTCQLDYKLICQVNWFQQKSGFKISAEASPGKLIPTKFKASFKENMVVGINKDPTQTSPLTTSISVAYDAESPPGKGPKIGLALDLDL